MLSKHGPSKMSCFFHGGFFTVNGLPMRFRHINVYNKKVGNVCPEKEDFMLGKTIYYPPQFSCGGYSMKFKVVMLNTRKQTRGPNAGGFNIFKVLPQSITCRGLS